MKMTKTKTCKACGIEYEPDSATNMRRCRPCYREYRCVKRRKKNPLKPRVYVTYTMGQERKCTTCSNTFEHYGRRGHICSPCHKAYNKAWLAGVVGKQSPELRKLIAGRRAAEQRRRKQEKRNRFNTWKAEKGCSRCPENDPICLDMHHLDPTEKENELSAAMGHWSWDRIMVEAAKCIVICANCHRKLHAKLREEEETILR